MLQFELYELQTDEKLAAETNDVHSRCIIKVGSIIIFGTGIVTTRKHKIFKKDFINIGNIIVISSTNRRNWKSQ